MSIALPVGVCFVWGVASTYLFFHGWLAFLGVVAGFIGLSKEQRDTRSVLLLILKYMLQSFALLAILYLGFQQLCAVRGFGYSAAETLVYLVSSTLALAVLLPRLRRRIDSIWQETNPCDLQKP